MTWKCERCGRANQFWRSRCEWCGKGVKGFSDGPGAPLEVGIDLADDEQASEPKGMSQEALEALLILMRPQNQCHGFRPPPSMDRCTRNDCPNRVLG